MSERVAQEAFRMIRWAETQGEAVCPKCSCGETYRITTRKLWKCRSCSHQFSITSGTIFASRKLPIRTYLLAIAIFVNGVKGHAALQLSRDLDVQYKTAFVLSHKLREAMARETADATLGGTVEVDGAYFGGQRKPANWKKNRLDRRLSQNQTGKRRVVVVLRERGGRTLPFVYKSEAQGVQAVVARVRPGTVMHADEARSWNILHDRFLTKRINHEECFSDGEACTNQAESFFSRLRRAELGIHHRIAGRYLQAYANEMAWREDNRRISNGVQYLAVAGAALNAPVSKSWCGYWQRSFGTKV